MGVAAARLLGRDHPQRLELGVGLYSLSNATLHRSGGGLRSRLGLTEGLGTLGQAASKALRLRASLEGVLDDGLEVL